jgi:hypothetical protein
LVEELLGASDHDRVFALFLTRWRDIMTQRIVQAASAIGGIDGVESLILAGSNGTANPWPLSDIDLIPIYADTTQTAAITQIDETRLALLEAWSTEGWHTGVDVGRLRFSVDELKSAFAAGDPDPVALLADERWYHSIDKAYGGRALIDPDGHAARLAAWFTTHRFDPAVVARRLEHSTAESRASLDLIDVQLARGGRVSAFVALLKSIQWYQIHMMEGWGERDNSFGRFGTRFEQAARTRGVIDICDSLDELSALTPELVYARLEQAPRWVQERRDRSWQARRYIGEAVTPLQNDRDVLRVSAMYELRLVTSPPYPRRLGVPPEDELRERARAMDVLLRTRIEADTG